MYMNTKESKLQTIIRNIFILIFIATVCTSNIFTNSIGNLDEIWNYNFARNISDGLIPYKDFNMVPMPLLFIICGLFLNIFGNQLIIMRCLAVILLTLIFFMVYKILENITKKEIASIAIVLFLILFKDIMCIDYNYCALLIGVILLYIELKKYKNDILKYNIKTDFFIGIIAGTSILFKQTTGIAISLACLRIQNICN